MEEIKNISVNFDEAGDCFAVVWASPPDTRYTATDDDRVQALVDAAGNLCGFKVSGISGIDDGEMGFVNVDLYPVMPPAGTE